MTVREFRQSKDYTEAMNKIKNYSKGFTFTLNYAEIPKRKANALRIIMQDCIKKGIVKSVNAGFSWIGERQSETFERL